VQVVKRQTCAACACVDKFNFHIPDEMWKRVVPPRYQNSVVCLPCFDEFARIKRVDYAGSLQGLYFAGDQAIFRFQTVLARSA
jgi:hypothetical protein